MTILAGDIKLMKSQVLSDETDGGGAMTGNEVVDGQSNNLFPDISELDRAYGRVSLRKAFAWIDTANTDSGMGAHVIITKKPADPNVGVNLFSRKDWFDTRPNAKDYMETYLAKAPRWAGTLLETQLTGQRAFQLLMQTTDTEPVVGQGMCLVQNEGLSSEYFQFVRVTDVVSVQRSFTVSSNQDKTYKVVTIGISDPLLYTFTGQTAQQFYAGNTPSAICRDTQVADAANYYGISDLTVNAAINDATVQVDSIYGQLVPSAQQETPIIDADAAGQNVALVAGNSGTTTWSGSLTVNTATSLYIGSSIMPSSVSFTLFGSAIVDSGGVLKKSDGTQVGNINYQIGQITWLAAAGSGNTSLTIIFKPAAAPTQPFCSSVEHVTTDNRGHNWTQTLVPIPAPATLTVSYMVQGKVYILRDNGAGQLIGADSSFGSGTVSYTTGTALLTTGALPDVGTDILWQWGTPIATFSRADLSVLPAYLEFDLAQTGVVASGGGVSVTWLLNGVSKTATSNSAGIFSGDATGTINYATGKGKLIPNVLPATNTVFTFSFNYGSPSAQTVSSVVPNSSQQLSFTIGTGTAIIPSSVQLEIPVTLPDGSQENVLTLTDTPINGTTGNLVDSSGVVYGAITYASGAVVVTPSIQLTTYTTNYGTYFVATG